MLRSCSAATRLRPPPHLRGLRQLCRHKSLTAAIERGKQSSHRSRSAATRSSYARTGRSTRYVPESLPYTTAASEFLYGYSVVNAAVKADRRKLYKLYIHERGWNHEGRPALVARAQNLGLSIQEVGDEYLRLMDKASGGRPHNGFILEASHLPQPPITKLSRSSMENAFFDVSLDKQSSEDARVNGRQTRYDYKTGGWRHPLLLYVDGVLDEGNLGAIARSAYFLGVDAIATPSRQSAPWSQIALKASAGAAEALPIFTVKRASFFLADSARNGWRIYASDAIPAESEIHAESQHSKSSSIPATTGYTTDAPSQVVFSFARNMKPLPADHSPLYSHPTILMMGAEGSGLRLSLLNQAHYKVGIRAGCGTNLIGVDSLNVSVAASILCYEFLKKPPTSPKQSDLLF